MNDTLTPEQFAIGETVYIVPVPGEAIREAVVTEVEKNGKVVVVQYCGVEKWKVADWVFRTRKEADERYWKFYEAAESRQQVEETATLRAECESHRNARRTLADDLVALGAGKPTVLELSRGADRRIAKLEAERDAALAEVARLKAEVDCDSCGGEGRLEPEDFEGIPIIGLPCPHCKDGRITALEAEVTRLKDLPEWIIRKLKTMEYYEPPTDGRDIRSEIQGWFHVLCFHYVQNRREVKTYSENCKAMKQLEAENARLKKDLQEISGCTQYLREQLESRHAQLRNTLPREDQTDLGASDDRPLGPDHPLYQSHGEGS